MKSIQAESKTDDFHLIKDEDEIWELQLGKWDSTTDRAWRQNENIAHHLTDGKRSESRRLSGLRPPEGDGGGGGAGANQDVTTHDTISAETTKPKA